MREYYQKNSKKIWFLLVITFVCLCLMYLKTRGQKEYYMDIYDLEWQGGYQEGDYYVIDEKNEKGLICNSKYLSLPKGDYVVRIYYDEQGVENTVRVKGGGMVVEKKLPLDQKKFEVPVTLTKQAIDFIVEIDYERTGKFCITAIEVIGNNLLYTDTVFLMILLTVMVICYFILDYRGWFLRLHRQQIYAWMFLAAAIILSCMPLLSDKLMIGHDTIGHAQRLEGLRSALSAGQFPPRIGLEENNGYGLLLTLYPDAFLYVPALLRILNVSIVGAFKLIYIFSNMVAAITAYIAVVSICKNNVVKEKLYWGGALAGLLYCLFPYRLINLYTRAAIGESLAMAFLPLLLVGLYHLFWGEKKKWYYLVIAVTAVIHSHIVTLLLITVFILSCAVIWFPRLWAGSWKEKRIVTAMKAAGFTILLNAGYLIPFAYFYLKKATRANELSNNSYVGDVLNIRDIFIGGDRNQSPLYQIPLLGIVGIVCLACIIIGIVKCKKKDAYYTFLCSIFAVAILCVVAATSIMPYQQLDKIGLIHGFMSTIQFPFRLFILAAPILAVCAGCLFLVCDWMREKSVYLFGLISAIVLISGCQSLEIYSPSLDAVDGIFYNHELMYTEYWPSGSKGTNRDNTDLSTSNGVTAEHYEKNGKIVTFLYTSTAEDSYVELPMFYYPGYTAKLSDGTKLPVEKGEDARIRVTVPKATEPMEVTVKYSEMLMFRIALGISIITLIAVGLVILKKIRLQPTRKIDIKQ